jgi:signal transduction histidine kinase
MKQMRLPVSPDLKKEKLKLRSLPEEDLQELLSSNSAELKRLRKELDIEAALERVRAKAMAMHKSEQLADTAKTLFEQFDLLGKIPDRMSIGIINEEKNRVELWVTDQHGNRLNHEFFFSLDEPTSIVKIFKAWREKKDQIVVDLTGENLQNWLTFVKDIAKLPIDESRVKGRRVQQAAFFSQGFLLFTTNEPVADELMRLLVRFAAVFDLSYTRFRDLLRAEAQAREAIRASSLDRVRAEIASMRSTNDLQRITPLIWHELSVLGVPFVRCGIFIIDEIRAIEHAYLSTPDGRSLAILNLPFNSNSLTKNSVEHWRSGTVYREHWNKMEFLSWTQSMMDQGQIQDKEIYQGASVAPESLDLHFVPFAQGMLYVGNTGPLSRDEIELVKSLAGAFSIAYARYEDFGRLEQAKQTVENTLNDLKSTQAQLIQSEKMASLGELTAGIAHEIQNPLNFVNNFSEINRELIIELVQTIQSGDIEESKLIAQNIEENETKINHHGKRADAIVKGMLQHSQSNTGKKEPTDINDLAEEYLRFAYHGIRAKDKLFNAVIKTDFDDTIGIINVVSADISRVMLNLYNNAFYAVNEKAKQLGNLFEAVISVSTMNKQDHLEIRVRDNGNGIPPNILGKIFQPFFTTKPPGQGTGLGLSLSYDIVKAHGGKISVETKEGEETQFVVELPY